MLARVGKELIQDIHRAAKEDALDCLSLFAGLRRCQDVAQTLGLGQRLEAIHRLRWALHVLEEIEHALRGVGAVHLHDVLRLPHPVDVQDDGRIARVADIARHDLVLDRIESVLVKLQVFDDGVGEREQRRAGDLEFVAVEEFDGGAHPTDVLVLLDAEDSHAAALQQSGRGQAVVTCADNDRVVVSQWDLLVLGAVASGEVIDTVMSVLFVSILKVIRHI